MSDHNHTSTVPFAETSAVSGIVITAFGFQLIARAEKARRMARALFQAGIPSADAVLMTQSDWKRLQTGLSEAGILGRFSTAPSGVTIDRTISELQILEARSAVFALRVENRIAA